MGPTSDRSGGLWDAQIVIPFDVLVKLAQL